MAFGIRVHYILRGMRIEAAVLLLVATYSIPAVNAETEIVSRIPPSVDEYSRAIRTDSTADVERLYRMGLGVADDLMSKAGSKSIGPYTETLVVLETLSDADFEATQRKMEGFFVFRELAEGVIVNPEFFERLSRERGDRVSLDFFKTLRETSDSESVGFPAYIRQTTDFSGCTRFGSLELVRCYRLLTAFRGRHPDRYADRMGELVGDLEREFTDAINSCGDKEGVEKEFRAFLGEFPTSTIAPRVHERLDSLEKGTLEMTFGVSPY